MIYRQKKESQMHTNLINSTSILSVHVCVCVQVYQVYAQRSPEEVYDILKAVGADYVVLENSICYERRHRRGCRLRDLLDLANGHVGGIYST